MEKRHAHKRTSLVMLLAGALLVAGMAVAVLLSLLPKRSKPPQAPVNPYQGMVRVSDGANLIWMTPKEGVAVSQLYRRDFTTADDGTVSYGGTRFTTRRGIDLSAYQETADWDKIAGSGVEFALLRIGYRGYSKGGLQPDNRFEEHLAGALKNGVAVGIYFFSQALTAEEGQEEAAYVLSLLDGRQLSLPVYFDWEPTYADDSRTAQYDYSQLTASADAFCRTIEAAGYDAGIYLNRQQGYYQYDLGQLTDYSLWVADPNSYPDFYYAMDIWQYSFTAQVPGLKTQVDMNLQFLPLT